MDFGILWKLNVKCYTLSDMVWARLQENSRSVRAGRGQEAEVASRVWLRFFGLVVLSSAVGALRMDPAFTGLSRLHLGPIWLSRFDLRCLASVCAQSGSV